MSENNDSTRAGQPEVGKSAGKGVIEGIVKALTSGDQPSESVHASLNVRMDVQIIIGRTRMPVSQLVSMSQGAVIELDRRIGDPVDVVVNDVVVARGELVAGKEDSLGVKLTEIVRDTASPAF